MTGFPFDVYVRHRGYRLPYPLYHWHLPEDREEEFAPEDFRPSEYDPVNLILRRARPEGILKLSIDGTPLQMTLQEGENYNEIAAWAPPRNENSDTGEGLWGRAGMYRIRVYDGEHEWITTIEVQPHYLTFEELGRMCADIEKMSTWVAYDILPYAPSLQSRMPRYAQTYGLNEDPAIQYALLKEAVPEALRTLRFLSVSPHLALKPTYVATRSGGSSREDRRTLRMEERLSRREEGWSVQRAGELSYDIFENRFVKRLLRDLQRRLSQLQTRFMDALYELERQEDEILRRLHQQFAEQEDRIRREEPLWTRPIRNRQGGLRSQIAACGRMRDSLEIPLRSELLKEVPPLRGIVRPTNVLQYDPQYSRLWSIYRLLRLSDRGESSLAHRFHRRSRPSWELYEMWTAVQVIETCMRDLRFTRLLSQTVAGETEGEVVYMYDTPRPATVRLSHETEPLIVEIVYGGYIPTSVQTWLAYQQVARPPTEVILQEEEMTLEPGETPADLPLSDLTVSDGETPENLDATSSDPIHEVDASAAGEQVLSLSTSSSESVPSLALVEASPPQVSMDDHPPTLSLESSIEVTKSDVPAAHTPLMEEEEEEFLPDATDVIPPFLATEDSLLVTRGVQTAPDVQVRFLDAETDEILGVIILDAKYKNAYRIWGNKEGQVTSDRLALESYLMDIHRRDRDESAVLLYSQPADEIVLKSFAMYPGERYGPDVLVERRRSEDGRMGVIQVSPDGDSPEELIQLLLESLAQVQMRRAYESQQSAWDSDPSLMGDYPA